MATQPFFIPQKEVDLIDSLNEELIDEIVGQVVDIYKVSVEDTETNVYGEAVGGGSKSWKDGYRVNCLIQFTEPETTLDEFGPDLDSSIELYFHRTSLSEADFYPEIGDVAEWNGFYWEINSVTEPQLIGGHQHFKHAIVALAHRTRLSSVNLESRPT